MPTPLHEAFRELFNDHPELLLRRIVDRLRLPGPALRTIGTSRLGRFASIGPGAIRS